MPLPIEDYAIVGDCQTAALVGRDGSIDWLCLPRFDSGACFAALLGEPEHGRWLLAPEGEVTKVERHYHDNTLVLETTFETADGAVSVIDCMPPRTERPDLVRMVVGRRGTVKMRMELVIRFDYGSIVPWVRRIDDDGIHAIAGPDAVVLRTPIETHGEDQKTVAEFTVSEGEEVPFVLIWYPSHEKVPERIDVKDTIEATAQWWRDWAGPCTYEGPWADLVRRSLITLKAMTYAPTGGIVAAVTTSLPEELGGVRNWDYRFCWLRDATFTLYSLLTNGYNNEACEWREWLLRAVAGNPEQAQIMYGLGGERRLTELELDWLPGYEGASPVRIGNAAYDQFQLDVYGEVMDALYVARSMGMPPNDAAWRVQLTVLQHLETVWKEPDEGIWEVRGPRQHFTHSKVMAWVAFDRSIKTVEEMGFEGPVERWRTIRQEIHDEVCTKGFDAERNTFVQHYNTKELDASLLVLVLVGFLPPDDPRLIGTIEAIQKDLCADGFVLRYRTHEVNDGLPPGEGAFLPCSFWLADALALVGRRDEARAYFEKLIELCNDVGLISEEYDPKTGRLVGNFPQAFTHVSLVNTASNLTKSEGPAVHRQGGES